MAQATERDMKPDGSLSSIDILNHRQRVQLCQSPQRNPMTMSSAQMCLDSSISVLESSLTGLGKLNTFSLPNIARQCHDVPLRVSYRLIPNKFDGWKSR